MRLSLTLSIAGHAILLGLLILVATDMRLPEPTDLDAGIDQMMRGAQLPRFPAGMTMSPIEVAVSIRFSLTR